jgi:hypothetical protein
MLAQHHLIEVLELPKEEVLEFSAIKVLALGRNRKYA